MPSVEPFWFTSLRRGTVGFGRAFRPALKPLAYGAAGVLAFRGVEGAIDAYGHVRNPPAQTIPVDVDPTRPGPESYGIFDPRTGRLVTFGAKPTDKGDNERSEERITTTAILAGAAIAGSLLFILATRK